MASACRASASRRRCPWRGPGELLSPQGDLGVERKRPGLGLLYDLVLL